MSDQDTARGVDYSQTQDEIKVALTSFISDRYVKRFITDVLVGVKENGSARLYSIVFWNLLSPRLLYSLFANVGISNMMTLLSCTYNEKYQKSLKDKAFIDKLIEDESIKGFHGLIAEHRSTIATIADSLLKLDDSSRQLVKAYVEFMSANAKHLGFNDIKHLYGLYRKYDSAKSDDSSEQSKELGKLLEGTLTILARFNSAEEGAKLRNFVEILISKVPTICFEVDVDAPRVDGKVVYKLTSSGLSLVEAGLLNFGEDIENPAEWRQTLDGTAEFKRFLDSKDNRKKLASKIAAKNPGITKDLIDAYYESKPLMTEAELIVYLKGTGLIQDQDALKEEVAKFISKQGGEEFVSELNVTADELAKLPVLNPDALKEILTPLICNRDTILAIKDLVTRQIVNKDIDSLFLAVKALEMITSNADLNSALVKHRGALVSLARTNMSEEMLAELGLDKDFLEVIAHLLEGENSLKTVEDILSYFNKGDLASMLENVSSLLVSRPNLLKFVGDNAEKVGRITNNPAVRDNIPGMTRYEVKDVDIGNMLSKTLVGILPLARDLTASAGVQMLYGQMASAFMKEESIIAEKFNPASECKFKAAEAELYQLLSLSDGQLPLALDTEEKQKHFANLSKALSRDNLSIDEVNQFFDRGHDRDLAEELAVIFKNASEKERKFILENFIKSVPLSGEQAISVIKEASDKESISRDLAFTFKSTFENAKNYEYFSKRLQHTLSLEQLLAATKSVHSNVIFYMASRASTIGLDDLNKAAVSEFIKANNLTAEDFANQAADIILNDGTSISKAEFVKALQDLSLKKESKEKSAAKKAMRGVIAAPIGISMQSSFSSESLNILESVKTVNFSDRINSAQILAILTEKGIDETEARLLTIRILAGNEDINPKGFHIAIDKVLAEPKVVEAKLNLIQKILAKVDESEDVKNAIKAFIAQGTNKSQADLALIIIKELFVEDTLTQDEKNLLGEIIMDAAIGNKDLMLEMLGKESYVNTILNRIPSILQLVFDKNTAKALYGNARFRAILEDGGFSFWTLLSLVRNIGLWQTGKNLATAVFSFAGNAIMSSVDQKNIEMLKQYLEVIQEPEIFAIARKHFPKLGSKLFAAHQLEGLDLSNRLVEGFDFSKSNFTGSKVNGATFKSCNFYKATIPADLDLTGVKFDFASFRSLLDNVKTAERLHKLVNGKGVVVKTSLAGEVDPEIIFALANNKKLQGDKWSEEALFDGIDSTSLELIKSMSAEERNAIFTLSNESGVPVTRVLENRGMIQRVNELGARIFDANDKQFKGSCLKAAFEILTLPEIRSVFGNEIDMSILTNIVLQKKSNMKISLNGVAAVENFKQSIKSMLTGQENKKLFEDVQTQVNSIIGKIQSKSRGNYDKLKANLTAAIFSLGETLDPYELDNLVSKIIERNLHFASDISSDFKSIVEICRLYMAPEFVSCIDPAEFINATEKKKEELSESPVFKLICTFSAVSGRSITLTDHHTVAFSEACQRSGLESAQNICSNLKITDEDSIKNLGMMIAASLFVHGSIPSEDRMKNVVGNVPSWSAYLLQRQPRTITTAAIEAFSPKGWLEQRFTKIPDFNEKFIGDVIKILSSSGIVRGQQTQTQQI